jgi:hypothetical protein
MGWGEFFKRRLFLLLERRELSRCEENGTDEVGGSFWKEQT